MSIIIHAEEFAYYFNREKFDLIYNQTTTDFQQLISQEQFKELATSFNQGVTHYQLEFQTTLADLTYYIWLDKLKIYNSLSLSTLSRAKWTSFCFELQLTSYTSNEFGRRYTPS